MSGRIVPIGLIDRSPWADESRAWVEDGFDLEAHVAWLAEDIEARGVQTPLHVFPRGGRYELLHGHNRLEAAKRAGLSMVPVEEKDLPDEDARREHFIKSNGHQHWSKSKVARAEWLRRPESTIREVADRSGVSYGTAYKARERLIDEGQFITDDKVTGADGKQYPRHKPRDPDPDPEPADQDDEPPTEEEDEVAAEAKRRPGISSEVPDGKTLEELVREFAPYREAGSTMAEVADAAGLTETTYRYSERIVSLYDHPDLSGKDRERADAALRDMNENAQPRATYMQVDDLFRRIYGDARSGDLAKREARRVADFERAFGALVQACAMAPDIDVPYLSPERADEVVSELGDAARAVRALATKIKEAS